jgi:hypothetical protein
MVSGCAWKTYDPKLHTTQSPTPTPTKATTDQEYARKYRQFQTTCSHRAVTVQGVQVLDQDPSAVVFRLRDGSQATVHFDKLYEKEPQAVPGTIDEYLARELGADAPAPRLEGIEPRLRTAVQIQPWRHQLEQSGVPPEEWPVWSPLVGDLFVTYVVEPPGSAQRWVVTAGQLARGGISPAQAREAAVNNLERRLGPEAVSRGQLPDSPLFQVAQDLAGVRILTRRLLASLAQDAGGDLLLCVPHPGCLVAVSAKGAQARDWLIGEARARSTEPDGLSAQIFSFSKATGRLSPVPER